MTRLVTLAEATRLTGSCTFTFKLPCQMKHRLYIAARATGAYASELVREALARYLDALADVIEEYAAAEAAGAAGVGRA